jgi:phosphoribosylamine---glycine ligase
MKVLVIGSGGREHALVWKLSQSPVIDRIYCAPGNPGIAELAHCLPIKPGDVQALRAFALAQAVDLTVVGPDDCLAAGVVDLFRASGLKIFGPTKLAARIESSKAFAKKLMHDAGIPTADHQAFTEYDAAIKYCSARRFPLVVKASGLALGKGVVICQKNSEAALALRAMMVDGRFGEAGREVIIEEFLEGDEVSIHAFCDGKTAKLFPPSRDHKRLRDGDLGPNTGGMGTCAPVPWVTARMMDSILKTIVLPAMRALADAGTPFCGCLYPGLIHTAAGFKVLGFNARFGDPETQSYMRLLESDLLDTLLACVDGRLEQAAISWSGGSAACVVAASPGYPGDYEKELEITGLAEARSLPDIVVFQAGTSSTNGKIVTSGGRVLSVTAAAATLPAAIDRCYSAMGKISFKGMHYRRDIGAKSLQ